GKRDNLGTGAALGSEMRHKPDHIVVPLVATPAGLDQVRDLRRAHGGKGGLASQWGGGAIVVRGLPVGVGTGHLLWRHRLPVVFEHSLECDDFSLVSALQFPLVWPGHGASKAHDAGGVEYLDPVSSV